MPPSQTRLAEREQAALALNALLTNAPIGLAFFDRAHRYTRINELLANINGMPVQAHLGHSIEELLPVNAPAVTPVIDQVFASGQAIDAVEIDGETPASPGEPRSWLVGFFPVFGEDGSVVEVGATVIDITDRKRAQAALVASESRLRDLNDNLERRVAAQARERDRMWRLSRDPFLVADVQGRWLSASPAWTDLLGWVEDELLGRTSAWMTHPDDQEPTQQEVERLARGELTLRFENRLRTRSGDYRWFSWTAVPEDGLVYAVARDVTEEKQRLSELVAAHEALRQAQKMEAVGQLTGGIAHDFNNLLQVMVGNMEWLSRTLPEDLERHRRAAASALSGAKRAAALTHRLLAFARRQPLDPKPLDAGAVVRGISDLLRRALGETIDLVTVYANDLWTAEADQNELESALLNLAVNGRDAMPSGGRLTIETANVQLDAAYAARHADVEPGPYVLISVTDNGTGMDAQTLARVFEPFFTTKPEGQGTGLGLSQIYGFVKQSRGHVSLTSELGVGTTARLYLPRFEAATPPAQAGARVPSGQARGETVLVVEDDAGVRAYTVSSLRELGYVVIEAGDAQSALTVLRGTRVDLLFTDVVLPGGMTGADLATRARQAWPTLRVLFTTGYARNAIVHQGRLDPGVKVLVKPFGFDDLAAKLREVLESA